MVDVTLLKDTIKHKGKTNAQIAETIGMNASTFYRKLNKNGATFTVAQAHKLAEVLEIDPDVAQNIFFGNNSHKCE